MAEKFVFEKGLAKRSHVDGIEGRFGTVAQLMDHAGQHLFAGSGFTVDDHAIIGAGHGFDLVKNQRHGFIFSDEMGECIGLLQMVEDLLLADPRQFIAEAVALEVVLNEGHQFVAVEGFDQIIARPAADRLHGSGHVVHGADDHTVHFREFFLDALHHLHAAHMRHHQIQQHEREALRPQSFQNPAAVGYQGGFRQSGADQSGLNAQQQPLIVIDDQDCRLLSGNWFHKKCKQNAAIVFEMRACLVRSVTFILDGNRMSVKRNDPV